VSVERDTFARQAEGWSDTQYADPGPYLEHRAALIERLGAPLVAGDEVLDLACGDGGLGVALRARGLRYRGVDLEPAMVEAARRRLGDGAPVSVGNLDTFVPPAPVAATTVFRAIYYSADRPALLAHVRTYTTTKLVFDLNPRQYRVADVLAELAAAGFGAVELRPFFVPQTVRLPRPLAAALHGLERVAPLARVALRFRFTYVVVARV
jgi:SAM-dependent methyltransferase